MPDMLQAVTVVLSVLWHKKCGLPALRQKNGYLTYHHIRVQTELPEQRTGLLLSYLLLQVCERLLHGRDSRLLLLYQ